MGNICDFRFGLLAGLHQSSFKIAPDGDHIITGNLKTELCKAKITIQYSPRFRNLRRVAPTVWCHEPWMRDEADWHNSKTNGMCWVLQEEWYDYQNISHKRRQDVVDDALRWIFGGITLLINRHHVGHVRNLDKWQEEWEAWEHEEKGNYGYRRERQTKRRRARQAA